MGDALRDDLEFATTQKPSTVRMTAVRSTTLVMGSRPVPLSPAAKSVEMRTIPADVVFEGEKLSTVDDFVRLRLHARSVTFLGVLIKEGLTPEYYAMMCGRFEAARRADPALEQRYRERLALGAKLLGR
jgi:hypothetical protein